MGLNSLIAAHEACLGLKLRVRIEQDWGGLHLARRLTAARARQALLFFFAPVGIWLWLELFRAVFLGVDNVAELGDQISPHSFQVRNFRAGAHLGAGSLKLIELIELDILRLWKL